MHDVTTDTTATSALERLAAQGIDPSDPEVREALLSLAQEAVAEEKSAREALAAKIDPALTAAADAVSTPENAHVSKSGNAGFRTNWSTLKDGRRIQIHVLTPKAKKA